MCLAIKEAPLEWTVKPKKARKFGMGTSPKQNKLRQGLGDT